jgi:hypothetical protein
MAEKRKKTVVIGEPTQRREPEPFFAFVGDEDRDARDPSKILPGGYRAPRGTIIRVPWASRT